MTALQTKPIDLEQLSPKEREDLLHELFYNIISVIWEQDTFEDFRDYTFPEKNVVANTMQLFLHEKKIVGFIQTKLLWNEQSKKKENFLRVSSHILREYRGKSSIDRYLATQITRFYWKSFFQGRKMTYFFIAITPASYYSAARYAFRIYPSYKKEMTSKEMENLHQVAQMMGIEIDEDRPLLGKNTHIFSDKEEENETWKLHPDPKVQFYLEKCPDYGSGRALLVLIPVTFSNLVISISTYGWHLFSRKMGWKKSSRDKIREHLKKS